MEELDSRARRALALMGIAAVGLVVAAGLYLRSTARPPVPPPPTTVTGLDWLSAQVGWIVVADSQQRSVLFHTVDGGRHWSRQFATVDGGVSVHFLDASHGVLTEPTPFPGSDPSLLRSDDAGDHWAPIQLAVDIGSRPNLSFFLDLDHGWVMVRTGRSDNSEDAEIYRTDDGGLTWTVVTRVDPISWVSHGFEEQGLKRWVSFRTLDDGFVGSLDPDGSASVYVSHDGGFDWRRVALPPPPGGWSPGSTLSLLPPRFSASGDGALMLVDTARASGGRVRVGRSNGPNLPAVVVYHTHDGGDTWDAPAPAPDGVNANLGDPAFLAGAAFVDGSAGWLTAGATAWVTADSGRTWIRRGQLPSGRSFASLATVDDQVAVAQGTASGAPWGLYVTEDAGRTWRELPSPR